MMIDSSVENQITLVSLPFRIK